MATTTIKKNPQAAIDLLNLRTGTYGEALKRGGSGSTTSDPFSFPTGIYILASSDYDTTDHKWPAKNMWGYLIKVSESNVLPSIGFIIAQDKMYYGYRANNATTNTWYTVSATESSYN